MGNWRERREEIWQEKDRERRETEAKGEANDRRLMPFFGLAFLLASPFYWGDTHLPRFMQVRGIVLLPFMEWLGGWGQLYALIGTIVVVIGLFVRAKQLDRDTPRVYLGRRPGALSKELMAEVDRELRGDD